MGRRCAFSLRRCPLPIVRCATTRGDAVTEWTDERIAALAKRAVRAAARRDELGVLRALQPASSMRGDEAFALCMDVGVNAATLLREVYEVTEYGPIEGRKYAPPERFAVAFIGACVAEDVAECRRLWGDLMVFASAAKSVLGYTSSVVNASVTVLVAVAGNLFVAVGVAP